MNKGNNKPELKTRRNFLNTLLGIVSGIFVTFIIYPIYNYLKPPKDTTPKPTTVEVGKVDDLKPNSGKIFKFGNEPGILIRTPSGELRAFTATCTHLACIVQYREDFEHIWCACHNGHYDLRGINIAGPPPRPLTLFKVNEKNGKVFVSVINT